MLNLVNLLYHLYSMTRRYCPMHLIKWNCLLKVLRTLILTHGVFNLDISLPLFFCRTNLKLHNISVTHVHNQPWFIKGTWSWLNSNGGLKEPPLEYNTWTHQYKLAESYILAGLFNMCQKKSWFPHCWKVSSVFPVLKNFGGRSTAKNYRPVSLLSVQFLESF